MDLDDGELGTGEDTSDIPRGPDQPDISQVAE